MKTYFRVLPDRPRLLATRDSFFLFSLVLLFSCSHRPGSSTGGQALTTIPCNMQTISLGNANWKATDKFENNQVFIAPPAREQWQDWYQELLGYRDHMRGLMNDPGNYFIDLNLLDPAEHYTYDHAAIQLNRDLSNKLKFLPGETIEIDLAVQHRSGSHTLYIGYEYNLLRLDKGAHTQAQPFVDSIGIPPGEAWQQVQLETTIPSFDTASLSILPMLSINTKRCDSNTHFYIKNITYKIAADSRRTACIDKLKPLTADPRMDRGIYDRPENKGNKQNFVMGFVFIWDKDFYDPHRNEYRVDHYCDLMQQEFGGFNSVILWHGYPMLGVDERNQFDMLRRMPGGLAKLHEVIGQFHRRNIKVFVAYTPWDLITRREGRSDQDAFTGILDSTGIDGIYFDTKAEGGAAFRDAVDRVNKGANFATELSPSFFDLQGPQACINSWAQYGSYQPLFADRYPGFGVLHSKWIIPDHMQFQIDRWRQDHTEELQTAWINGSGIMVWENIFGSWNPWNRGNKKELRTMNGLWQSFSDLYTSDNWKPYYPTNVSTIISSVWEDDSVRLINLVNLSAQSGSYTLPAELMDKGDFVYDLWNGKPINSTDPVTIEKMGCILVKKMLSATSRDEFPELAGLLDKQAAIARQTTTGKDNYAAAIPVKGYLHYRYPSRTVFSATTVRSTRSSHPTHSNHPSRHTHSARPAHSGRSTPSDRSAHAAQLPVPIQLPAPAIAAPIKTADLLPVAAGDYTIHISHLDRECGCYPDPSTPDSLVWDKFLRGDHRQTKTHTLPFHTAAYAIMPRVVTNGEFETFLRATRYRPASTEFFLVHWQGPACPEALKDSPVVYVDLGDARAYAGWAGMQLPTEEEWQEAAEQDSARFRCNEVFELTESVRDDGHNRFLMLRGGSPWNPWSSEWYFPGGFYPGNTQPINSHVKQLLMYPGIDRASTIGFRCIKKSTDEKIRTYH
jgi:formylglycine-generating enzyme required for sulfatase activity